MKRRFWSVCMALALCWTLLPATALAAGEATVYVGGKALTSTNDTTVYATTDEDSGEVQPITSTGSEPSEWNIKWDGTTLTLKDATITEGAHQNAAIYREGGLKIKLIGVNTVTGPDNSSEDSTGIYIGQGDLTIDAADDGDSLDVSGGSSSSASYGIRASNFRAGNGGNITISGGTVTASGGQSTSNNSYGIGAWKSNGSGGAITISGGTVTAAGGTAGLESIGIFAYFGQITISGGDVTATGGNAGRSYGLSTQDIVTVSGGTVTVTGGDGGFYSTSSTGGISISGDSVVRANATDDGGKPLYIIGTITKTNGIVFENGGGTVYGSVELQENLTIGADETLTISDTASLTIPSGVTLTNNGTVTIEKDGTLTNNCVLANDGTVTVDGTIENNHFIRNDGTFSGSGTIKNNPAKGSFYNYGTVTVTVGGNPVTHCVTDVGISPPSLILTVGETADLTAVLTPADANYQSVSWSSDKEAVATVTEDSSDETRATVTALAPGTATITVGGQNADAAVLPGAACTVTVTAPVTPEEPVTPPSDDSEPTYSPSLDVGDGGTVKVSPRTPEAGEEVTLTVTPDEGYAVEEVSVTDRDGDPVDVTAHRDGTYTFEQPRGRVTIEVTFREVSQGTPFADVPEDYWAYDAIAWAYENGYVSGTSAGTFSPGASISRQQVWMILARLSGGAPADMAAARAWAVDLGISDGTDPGGAVTRQQLAALLYRFAQANGYDSGQRAALTGFPDAASVSAYAVEALQWATASGIINGTSAGTLNPAGTATRAQFAVMLERFWGPYLGA